MRHTPRRAGLLKSALLAAAAIGALGFAGAGIAQANPVQIGFASAISTTPGGTPPAANNASDYIGASHPGNTYSTNSTTGTAIFGGSFGNVAVSIDGGIGSPTNPMPTLTSNINVSFGQVPDASTVNTAYVYVTETDLTSPVGSYELASAFSATNTTSGIAYVTESTFIDQSNTAFGMATAVKTRTFGNGTGTIGGAGSGTPNVFNTASTLTSPYSLTEVFEIQTVVPTTPGVTPSIGGAISTSAVPEPGSLALLGTGLLGLGLVARRRRRTA